MRVLDFAIDLERTGSSYFRYLADKTSHRDASAVFRMMADEEESVAAKFESIRNESEEARLAESIFLDDKVDLFGKMHETQEGFRASDNVDAYRYVMRVEADICRLYEEAAGKEPLPEVRNLLRRLAREERRELEKLDQIYEFINAPNEYLAWREFSNLEEFHNFGRDEG